jgi:flavin-dependent dehydrogenase
MTKAAGLKARQGNIDLLQKEVLSQNPHLKKLFRESKVLPGFPVTISQISFSAKTSIEDGVLMLGDAAGMITPLCGNGMSIALHTGKLAAGLTHRFLMGELDRSGLEKAYGEEWRRIFAGRLQRGRLLQRFFGSVWLSNAFVGLFKLFPFLAKPVIRSTHGTPF